MLNRKQAKFLKRAIEAMLLGKEFIQANFHTGDTFPRVEVYVKRTLMGVKIFEYEHNPGTFGGHILDSYGVTDLMNDFGDFTIKPEDRSFSFKILNGYGVPIYRTYALMNPEEGDYILWMDFKKESWKLR